MPSNDTMPIEASYESAKQSIISYIAEVSRVYDLPILLINNLIYEIALESRNASFSTIIGNCNVTYPEQEVPETQPKPQPQPQHREPKTVTMNKEDAFKEFKKMGLVKEEPSPSTDKSA